MNEEQLQNEKNNQLEVIFLFCLLGLLASISFGFWLIKLYIMKWVFLN